MRKGERVWMRIIDRKGLPPFTPECVHELAATIVSINEQNGTALVEHWNLRIPYRYLTTLDALRPRAIPA